MARRASRLGAGGAFFLPPRPGADFSRQVGGERHQTASTSEKWSQNQALVTRWHRKPACDCQTAMPAIGIRDLDHRNSLTASRGKTLATTSQRHAAPWLFVRMRTVADSPLFTFPSIFNFCVCWRIRGSTGKPASGAFHLALSLTTFCLELDRLEVWTWWTWRMLGRAGNYDALTVITTYIY